MEHERFIEVRNLSPREVQIRAERLGVLEQERQRALRFQRGRTTSNFLKSASDSPSESTNMMVEGEVDQDTDKDTHNPKLPQSKLPQSKMTWTDIKPPKGLLRNEDKMTKQEVAEELRRELGMMGGIDRYEILNPRNTSNIEIDESVGDARVSYYKEKRSINDDFNDAFGVNVNQTGPADNWEEVEDIDGENVEDFKGDHELDFRDKEIHKVDVTPEPSY
mmetsp:Transcript_29829/g.52377  ORF Transcript_29829/g.52377 Transcript_29829/m.52377 type:complete len:220 (-) Transcript_29829:240-899(-)